jgi:hypothetical protein
MVENNKIKRQPHPHLPPLFGKIELIFVVGCETEHRSMRGFEQPSTDSLRISKIVRSHGLPTFEPN